MQSTHNNGATYEHSLDHALEFFSKAGSLFSKRQSFYGNEESALSLFQKTWIVNKEVSFKLLLWLRDCRGGAGNRSAFRECLTWLATTDPEWVKVNIASIPAAGRWDDLKALYDTPCEEAALEAWTQGIQAGDDKNLAAKWANRRDNKLRKHLKMTPKDYRKLLVSRTAVVENKMTARQWQEIDYPTVPSVAMARYTNAFKKRDTERYEKFKTAVAAGETSVNASTLFPHDCVRTARNGDAELANLQFAALPNYFADTNKRILCLCDSSGSMSVQVSGSVAAIDVSTSLSLYCSDRLASDSPFYRKFMQFEDESQLTDWKDMTFSDVITGGTVLNGAVGSTDLQKALTTLLAYAKMFNATPEQMPSVLLVISDMQFNQGVHQPNQTEIEHSIDQWVKAGYERPTLVYWNTAGYAGAPATIRDETVALVSGFSPSVLQALFSSDDLSAAAVLNRALEKYAVVAPK